MPVLYPPLASKHTIGTGKDVYNEWRGERKKDSQSDSATA